LQKQSLSKHFLLESKDSKLRSVYSNLIFLTKPQWEDRGTNGFKLRADREEAVSSLELNILRAIPVVGSAVSIYRIWKADK
jgi:hypothetical protein